MYSRIGKGLITGGWSLKKGRTISTFRCVESDGLWWLHGRYSMRSGQCKDHTLQKYLITSSKYCILVQFAHRSIERIAISLKSLQFTLKIRYAWWKRRSCIVKYTELQVRRPTRSLRTIAWDDSIESSSCRETWSNNEHVFATIWEFLE